MCKMLGNFNVGFLLINISSLNDCCLLCWIRVFYFEKKDVLKVLIEIRFKKFL